MLRGPKYLLLAWSVIFTLGCALSISMLVIHIKMTYRDITKPKNQHNKQNPRTQTSLLFPAMRILTMLSIVGFSISIIMGGIGHFTCVEPLDRMTPFFYQLGKCCIYIGLIMRISFLYSASGLANDRYLLFLNVYNVVLVVMYSALGIIGIFSIKHNKLEWVYINVTVCRKEFHISYLLCSLLFDIGNTVLLLLLYITPLLSIMRALQEDFNGKYYKYSGKDLKFPVVKISILTSIATLSSVIAHIITIITGTYVPFLVDIPINILCVMLMAPFYRKETYQRICCGIIYIVEWCDECCSIRYGECKVRFIFIAWSNCFKVWQLYFLIQNLIRES